MTNCHLLSAFHKILSIRTEGDNWIIHASKVSYSTIIQINCTVEASHRSYEGSEVTNRSSMKHIKLFDCCILSRWQLNEFRSQTCLSLSANKISCLVCSLIMEGKDLFDVIDSISSLQHLLYGQCLFVYDIEVIVVSQGNVSIFQIEQKWASNNLKETICLDRWAWIWKGILNTLKISTFDVHLPQRRLFSLYWMSRMYSSVTSVPALKPFSW